MDGGEQDRSELPTPHRLKKAREQGSVARGTDLGFLVAAGSFLGFAIVQGHGLAATVAQSARDAFAVAPGLADDPATVVQVTGLVLSSAIRPLAVLTGFTFLAVLLFELLQTGVVFSAEPLKPDFGRLSPGRGLRRVFSVRLLIETLKGVLKLTVYTGVAFLIIRAAYRDEVATTATQLLAALGGAGLHLLEAFIGVAVFFAVLDQFIARRDFLKRMRMSRREIRREARDREGDPRIKQRRRRLHREYVKQSRSVRNVPGADVLVTNPTHLAIALRYDQATMGAPKIVSRGADLLALRLRAIAFQYGVVIIEDRILARELYAVGDIDTPIPAILFRPVADIYLGLRAQGRLKER